MIRKCHCANTHNSYSPVSMGDTLDAYTLRERNTKRQYRALENDIEWASECIQMTKTFKQKQTNTQSQHNLIYWYNFQSVAYEFSHIKPILTECTQSLCHGCCHNNTKNIPLIKTLEYLYEFDLILIYQHQKPFIYFCAVIISPTIIPIDRMKWNGLAWMLTLFIS